LEEEEEAAMRRQALRCGRRVRRTRLLEKAVACIDDGCLSDTRRAWVRVRAASRRRRRRRRGSLVGGEVFILPGCRPVQYMGRAA
jgi:hypothetical protein